MATIKHLGLNRKLRNGGRYGVPSNLIKNAHISDIDDLRAYMDLYMGKEDKKTWEYIYNLSGNIDSAQTGVTGEGIDYAAVTIHDLGKTLPITIFLYETPDNKLNIYLPIRGNMCLNKKPIPDCSSLIPQQDVESYLRTSPLGQMLTDQIYDKHDHYDLLDKGIFKVGPDKIEINYDGEQIEVVSDMDLMIEDFSHRVVLKGSKPKIAKPKPTIGGTDKELLIVHPDAEDWLSRLFGYKTKGIYTGMSSGNPDAPTPDDVRGWGVDYPIYQFDKGTLYEKTISGSRDRAVWRLDEFDEYLEYPVIAKIKKLYPGIQPSDIFMSDED